MTFHDTITGPEKHRGAYAVVNEGAEAWQSLFFQIAVLAVSSILAVRLLYRALRMDLMATARLSPFSHLVWLGYWQQTCSDMPQVVMHLRQVTHRVEYLADGAADVRWVCRGREHRFHAAAGTVEFSPADGEERVLIGTNNPTNVPQSLYTLFIPQSHTDEIIAAEGCSPTVPLRYTLAADDSVLTRCMARLSLPDSADERNHDGHKDAAARRLILRLVELSGGRPEWHGDTSTFDSRTLGHFVSYIDAHLRIAPTLCDMAGIAGLSPSHFARKFRQSAGLSLQRFINYRRIQTSLGLLKDHSIPLAHVAFELGFSSQSHFTRLFSDLTGMTPAKYRNQFRRVVG